MNTIKIITISCALWLPCAASAQNAVDECIVKRLTPIKISSRLFATPGVAESTKRNIYETFASCYKMLDSVNFANYGSIAQAGPTQEYVITTLQHHCAVELMQVELDNLFKDYILKMSALERSRRD